MLFQILFHALMTMYFQIAVWMLYIVKQNQNQLVGETIGTTVIDLLNGVVE